MNALLRGDIRQTLLLIALLPALLVAAVLFTYFVSSQLNTLSDSLEERGRTITAQLAPAAEHGVVAGNPVLLRRLMTMFRDDEELAAVAITSASGEFLWQEGVLHHTGAIGSGEAGGPAGRCAEGDSRWLFCAPIPRTRLLVEDFGAGDVSSTADHVGWVYVEMSTKPMQQRRNDLVVQAAAITGVMLALGALVAVAASRRIGRPIIAISESLEAVGRGEQVGPVEVSSSGELRTLQQGFNSMMADLKSTHEQMEGRIEEATDELLTALDELENKNIALEVERARAQAASRAKTRFLANMSHEIRTPMSGIIGMAELLNRTELDHVQRDYVDALQVAAGNLHVLLDDILDMAKIEAGKLKLQQRPVALRTAAEDVARMLAPSAHTRGLELVCDVNPDLPEWVIGDAQKLKQVLTNLGINAIKYTEEGEVVVRARRLAAPVSENGNEPVCRVRFEVQDSGIGIPEEARAELFKSFSRVEEGSTIHGTGLGTTIAQEFVELMGGSIGFETEVGVGSTFWFEINFTVVNEAEAVDPLPLEGESVLVVTACVAEGEALTHYLEALGATVAVVQDEDGALAWLEWARPDWVLLARAPGCGQGDAANQLDRACGGRVPIICLLPLGDEMELPPCRRQLRKPVLWQQLQELFNAPDGGRPALEVKPAPQRALRVLLVEDNPINARVIMAFLEQSGHTVIWENDGSRGLARLRREAVDLVLVDLRMPRMGGLEMTRIWRDDEAVDEHLPIVALTANATDADRAACADADMDGFLSKPVTAEQLEKTLWQVVGPAAP